MMCNNDTHDCGGGLYVCYNYLTGNPSKIIIENNLIANNNNKGVRVRTDSTIFINNTIVNNQLFGIYSDSDISNITIINCISWGNQYPGVYVLKPHVVDSLFSDIEGTQMNRNPLFVAPSAGYGDGYNGYGANWSLQNSSPCINSGTPDTTGLQLPLNDLASNPRIFDNIIDIGAFEYQSYITIDPKYINNNIINLYPNPAEDKITIEILELTENSHVTILDSKASELIKNNISNLKVQIDISSLQNGLYFAKIQTGKAISILKFIKNKPRSS
jgi:hypothetical protein